MKFIMETISGRKGIKNFNNLYEYIDFMTKNGNKIKFIKESELPYNDKPVKLPSVSTSKGWKQIDSSAFGDIGDKPEKGDCLLPSGNQGVFKNNAQFEPSKSSETPDKSESPKIENSPVKTDNEGEEKDLPKFKYEDSEKEDSKEYESSEKENKKEDTKESNTKKEDKDKEKVNEAVEVEPDMFDTNYDKTFVDSRQTLDFHDVYDAMEEIAPRLSYTDDIEQNGKITLIYTSNGANLDNSEFNRIKNELNKRFNGSVVAKFAQSQYAPEQKKLYIEYIQEPEKELNESNEDNTFDNVVNELYDCIINQLGEEAFDMESDTDSTVWDAVDDFGSQIDGYNRDMQDEYVDALIQKHNANNLNEGFKDGLKKAGKFAKGAIAGAAMAGALAGNAHGMEDPYYDGATRPDSSYEQVYDINGIEYTMPELKQIQKEQGLSDEELQNLINGEDPYYDGATQPFDSEINETLRLAGVQLNEDEAFDNVEEQINNEEDGEIDKKTGKKKLFEKDPEEEKEEKEKSPLEKAKEALEYWKERQWMNEIGNDMYYSSRQKREDDENIRYWRDEVKRLSKENEENLQEADNETLEETKPARLKHHVFNKDSFANISAERNNPIYEPVEGDTPKIDAYKNKMKQKQSAENNKKTEDLKKDLKDMGLSYIKTYGAWRENDKTTNEKSFLVPNITKEQALELGKKYGQYSVIFKDEGDDTAYMYITLDNPQYGEVDMEFDVSKDSGLDDKLDKDLTQNFTGYSGLKKGGHGYNYKYKGKDED